MVGSKIISIEVALKSPVSHDEHIVQQSVLSYLRKNKIRPGVIIDNFSNDLILEDNVKCVIIEDLPNSSDFIDLSVFKIKWFIYNVDTSKPMIQNEYNSDCEVNIATHLVLPNVDLIDSWENLHYDDDIKDKLLRYAHTMMEFSDKGVNHNVITCNKVILLHGPPGTGKTSLCKALAHKLTIRMQDIYSSGLLIEINSHSLFSKYFSESGKLVTKMFSSVSEVLENDKILVFVLIDEVESLAHARENCMSGTEPSDSIRVVNAVLTQIDRIRKHKNVIMLATSNLTKSIDLAFIDRADIKQYLGLPKVPAIYKIYTSCLEELQRVGILERDCLFEPVNVVMKKQQEKLNESTRKLLGVCKLSEGLSGRSLRKIPFIGHSLYSKRENKSAVQFLSVLEKAIEKEKTDRNNFN